MVQGERTLVVMTNGDVYYLSTNDARDLTDELNRGTYPLFRFVDIKSGAAVTLNLSNISSLVKEADRG